MHIIDWIIVVAIMIGLVAIALVSNRYTKSVAGFLAANRCAGKYLLTVAEGGAGVGLISIVAMWEMYYNAGLGALWWSRLTFPVILLTTLSGWVIYRYRQTRAMTMAQFFEIRYSRKLRIFSGILGWLSGLLNYGIFPAITARAVIYFLDLPIIHYSLYGLELNITMGIVMAILLGFAVSLTSIGGQIAVIITDFVQGQLFTIVFIAVSIFLLCKVDFSSIMEALGNMPVGNSKINPYDQAEQHGFDVSYFVMFACLALYNFKAWQGVQGYNCSAKSAHEARMATILANWRGQTVLLLTIICPIVIFTIFNSPQYSQMAAKITPELEGISDPKLQNQMMIMVGLRTLLPAGLLGFMVVSCIAAAVSTDDTYMHSWGSIFIQDVIMPFRKKPLGPRQHIRLLKTSIIGVAVFAWFFSMLFPLREYILMYFQITGALYLGGAGSAIVGGLYWKRATTAGAWTGMIAGSSLSICGIILKNILWPKIPQIQQANIDVEWLQALPADFPFNGMQMAFVFSLTAIVLYIIVSLLTKPKPGFNMDKMLHRGQYDDQQNNNRNQPTHRKVSWLSHRLGITSEFSKTDKLIYYSSMIYSLVLFVILVAVSLLHLRYRFSNEQWAVWWILDIGFIAVTAVIMLFWLLIGGIKDIIYMFSILKNATIDTSDDGSVRQ